MAVIAEPLTEPDPDSDSAGGGTGVRRALIAVITVAALVLAGGIGYVVGNRNHASFPTATSVDAGFAWDMSVHHVQAVTMAGFVRDHTTDPTIKSLAYDIETSQFNQVGQMQGWLDAWGLPSQSTQPRMAWMAGSGHTLESDGLMPGMATPAQITKLESLSGTALNIFFLQLMLNHHLGGLPMVQWGEQHAKEPYVRNAAEKMYASQSSEVVLMESMLRQDGASPLPPPD